MSKNTKEFIRKRHHIITSKQCNNNCIFCCDRAYPNGEFYLPTELPRMWDGPYLTLEAFIKSNKKIKNIDSIIFTGVEPTLNKNLAPIIRAAKELGYGTIALQTNGCL